VLAGHNEAPDPDPARPSLGEIRIRQRPEPLQRRSEQPDDLPPRIEPDDRVRVPDPLGLGYRRQLRRLGRRQADAGRPPRGTARRSA
jgi:hypothetical protein